MKTVSLSGKVTAANGQPIANAQIRLISDLATLGAAPNAIVLTRIATTWNDHAPGISGNAWHIYNRHIAHAVAGISFAEFKAQVVEQNPMLAATQLRFQPEERYRLPQNITGVAEITWDRTLTGFAGNRWQCWQRYVAGKVVGITWHDFKQQVSLYNPTLKEAGGRFQAEQTYQLPLNPHLTEYAFFTTTALHGGYKVTELPAGNYRLEIEVAGQERQEFALSVNDDMEFDFSLFLPVVTAQNMLGFVYTEGKLFKLNNSNFKRFVGVNIRGLAHYGETNHGQLIIGGSTSAHRKQALTEARDHAGARVVRLFLPHYSCPKEEIKRRLQETVAKLKEVSQTMYLLPALINEYHDMGFFPFPEQEVNDNFYAQQGQYRRLLPKFFVPPYCQPYLDFVDFIVSEFSNERAIFAWEIGNELKLDPGHTPNIDAKDFVAFNHMLAERIKRVDPNHMVTTGLKSTQHPHMLNKRDLAEKLYNLRRPNNERLIDFMTIHSYVDPDEPQVEKDGFKLDAQLAKALNLPFIIEETGVKKNVTNFEEALEAHMEHWLNKAANSAEGNAAGFMQWGFCPSGVGDGDGANWDTREVIKRVYPKQGQLLAI